jgi:hypothetical protein
LFAGAANNLLDVEGLAGLGEDGLDQGDAGLGWGCGPGALRGWTAQQAQGAELGVGGRFEDFQEVLSLEG